MPPALRVLHVAETVGGGIATYLNTLLPWQIAHYGKGGVGLVFPASDSHTLSAEVRRDVVLFDYVRSGRDPASLMALRSRLASACRQFRPGLIHAHSSFAGGLTRLRRSVPVVYTPHGWAFAREGSALARRIFALLERWLARRTALIIAVSADELRLAVEAGIGADKLVKVLSGLPDHPAAPLPRPAADTPPLRLVFVGRFDRQKGLDWLLQALAPLLPDQIRLTAVGAPWVDGQLPGEPLAGVDYPGWVAPEQLDSHLDAADALVMPSRWEAFGLVALEAMRRGVAVIASRRGALPELLDDGAAGLLFDLEDPAAFRELLLAQTRGTLAALGARGRERFLGHFTAARMCEGIDAAYRSIGRQRAP